MERIDRLKEFLRVNPTDSFIQHALALEFVKKGDDAEARRLFEELLSRDPGYTGSYYHLGKLFERNGDTKSALNWYEKGMEQTHKAGDRHAYGELKGAWEELGM